MSEPRGDDAYLDPYREAVKAFGASFEATLWLSREKQVRRFAVFTEMLDFTGRVIVDAGCGLGDFAAFLDTCEIPYGRYIGLEALPEMVEKASARGLPEAEFHVADFARGIHVFREHEPDIVLFSGSLNTFELEPMLGVIDRAYDACAEAVAFNLLSSRNSAPPSDPDDPARRHDPLAVLAHLLGRTALVAFRQDYMDGRDATFVAARSVPSGEALEME
ncbi:MAG: class I SAM-dependent methyltransferase [Phycisphaerales bacterium]|nr:class I SAM-dependent methyltransferase [Phycisphaerales bacterium]